MISRRPSKTRTDTLLPSTTIFRAGRTGIVKAPRHPLQVPPTEHSRTNRTLFTATLLGAAMAMAGCKPSTDAAAPEDAATPAPAVAPAAADPAADEHPTDVLRAVDNAPAPEGLDVRAFAGRRSEEHTSELQ